ncbi:IgE binding [Blomia tropicalis]|nr:IgE binding [Blomia tropicalis]
MYCLISPLMLMLIHLILMTVALDQVSNADPIIDLVSVTEQTDDVGCDDEEWYRFGDKCFKYHNDLVGANFHNAITICLHTYHAQVATIHSDEEAQFINSLLFKVHKSKFSAWIGLMRINNSSFIWMDRSPLNYTNWAPNEPNNWNSKNYCVVISSETDHRGKWYDVSCTSTYVVICEKSVYSKKNPTIFGEINEKVSNLQLNVVRLEENMNVLQRDVSMVVANALQMERNVSILQTNMNQKSSQQSKDSTNHSSRSRMSEINFILIIFIILCLMIMAFFNAIQSGRCCQSEACNWIDRDKLWQATNTDTSYIPGRLDRFWHSTLKHFKPKSQSEYSASFTATEESNMATTTDVDGLTQPITSI